MDSEGSQTTVTERQDSLVKPGFTLGTVTDKISSIVLTRGTTKGWLGGFAIAFALFVLLNIAMGYLFYRGVGIWGINIPVAWAFAITNFVWWIGIGHAGTLISAFLLLMHQKWRTSINRFAEAMTIFAVACAGMFPLLHMGRPWLFYYLLPYPNVMWLWPQFRSPLVWDVFAVSTYMTVSILFWYVGLLPDLATLRDKAKKKISQITYGFFSMGWRGSASHWKRYEVASLLLAGVATPLVVSVHTVVSFDFSIALVPGWHSTIFPPYFVAGAIYSGFAMVLTLAIPLRKFYGLDGMITIKHLDIMGKVMLATGVIVAYGYIMETFMAFYSGNPFDHYMIMNRMVGPYLYVYWTLIACNIAIPQALWFRSVRRNPLALFFVSIVINVGMWLERFVIIVVSLHREYPPSYWGMFYPTRWDWAILAGSFGLFFTLFYLFIRFLPMISIVEMRALVHKTEKKEQAA
ncbi:MAG TPA: NrfD/PsrC family molybdoenzyme membrane anchor subunit [Candidatus Acidoferrum sp.]|nr:NrfD/PsrC family molybdoenzyme membrane anchor subunit [Candidatus Acidoferrum sp.]